MKIIFFEVILLLSCHQTPNTINSGIDTSSAKDRINGMHTILTSAKIFDNQQPFEIISVTSSINHNTTDPDTSKCSNWKIGLSDVDKIIKNSTPIDGTTWDLNFLVLASTKSVHIVQNGQDFNIELNAGSFFWVKSGDTSVLFGDYKKSDRKYFIESPDTQ